MSLIVGSWVKKTESKEEDEGMDEVEEYSRSQQDRERKQERKGNQSINQSIEEGALNMMWIRCTGGLSAGHHVRTSKEYKRSVFV
jgi:hypothetical protein